jgi:hypothetical protein
MTTAADEVTTTARKRCGRHVDRPVEEGVGIRLEPDDLAEPGRFGRVQNWARPTAWRVAGRLSDAR